MPALPNSNKNALDLIKRDVVLAPVIEPGGARALMVGHLLGDFELAAVAQVLRDARRPKRVAADLRGDRGGLRAPPNHPVDIGLAHGVV